MRYYLSLTILILLALGTYFFVPISYHIIIWLMLLLIYLVIAIYGCIKISSQIYVKTLCKNTKAIGRVSITFDDGPETKYTPQILKLLEKYNAKASFFVIGEKCVLCSDILKEIDNSGHLLGNHSFKHKNTFPILNVKNLIKEINQTQVIVKKIIGKDMQYFRPPFGVTNPLLFRALRKFDFKVIGWSIRTLDTVKSKEEVLGKIKLNVKSGDIILLHSTTSDIAWILENTLKYLEQKSLKSITLDQLLSFK